jgi:hypothetical protein
MPKRKRDHDVVVSAQTLYPGPLSQAAVKLKTV